MTLLINARFRGHTVTGSQRYASEILSRLSIPHKEIMPSKPILGIQGHLWEQTKLARLANSGPLWSPCQTGPILYERQVVSILDMSFFDTPSSFSWKFRQWYRFAIRRLAHRARHIITISEFSKSRILHWTGIPPDRITPILLGVDAAFSPATQRSREEQLNILGLPSEPYALYVGSLEPRKNLSGLLEAWGASRDSRPIGTKLFVTGKVGNSSVFSSGNLGDLPSDVHLTGYVPDKDLPGLYCGASLFIYPSTYEGFGLPVLEAMSCGTPVAASSTTSIPEVGGKAIRYFDPSSVGSMARTIADCLTDQEWIQNARNAGIEQARKFTWEMSAKEHERVLSKFLNL